MASSTGGYPQKNPKVVLEVRAKLKERGIACTGENLKQVLSKAELQRLSSSLHSAMSKGKKAGYKLLKNDDERRNFLAAYALDPQDFRGSCQCAMDAHCVHTALSRRKDTFQE